MKQFIQKYIGYIGQLNILSVKINVAINVKHETVQQNKKIAKLFQDNKMLCNINFFQDHTTINDQSNFENRLFKSLILQFLPDLQRQYLKTTILLSKY